MHLMDGASRLGVAGKFLTAEKAAELRSAWTGEGARPHTSKSYTNKAKAVSSALTAEC